MNRDLEDEGTSQAGIWRSHFPGLGRASAKAPSKSLREKPPGGSVAGAERARGSHSDRAEREGGGRPEKLASPGRALGSF